MRARVRVRVRMRVRVRVRVRVMVRVGSEISTSRPEISSSHRKATLTKPMPRKSELWWRKYLDKGRG